MEYAARPRRLYGANAVPGCVAELHFHRVPQGSTQWTKADGQGHHTDQYRIYEALACGSLPVLLTGHQDLHDQVPPIFHGAASPLLLAADLPTALGQMQALLAAPEVLQQRQISSLSWYQDMLDRTLLQLDRALLSHPRT